MHPHSGGHALGKGALAQPTRSLGLMTSYVNPGINMKELMANVLSTMQTLLARRGRREGLMVLNSQVVAGQNQGVSCLL